jgi:hypothetical protein
VALRGDLEVQNARSGRQLLVDAPGAAVVTVQDRLGPLAFLRVLQDPGRAGSGWALRGRGWAV